MQNISLNSVYDWLSYDIVRFKIEVGVEEKCMYKNLTLNTRKIASVAAARLRRHYHDVDLSTLSINKIDCDSPFGINMPGEGRS